MTNNILNEKLDTGYKDIAGNIIYIGSTLSNPSFERAFDVFPGVVYVDYDGKLAINYKSRKNKNGGGTQYLNKSVASKCLVIEELKKHAI